MNVDAVLFDVIGTTVIESDSNLINHCFEEAFRSHGLTVTPSLIRANRGKDKRETIRDYLIQAGENSTLENKVFERFLSEVKSNVENFVAAPDAVAVFDFLRAHHVKIALGTGLPRELFAMILRHLKWDQQRFDYSATSFEVGAGRPNPAMIHDMMKKLGLQDLRRIIKVGDTAVDIQEAKNAGVISVAVLSGTQEMEVLEREKPDALLHSLKDIENILGS